MATDDLTLDYMKQLQDAPAFKTLEEEAMSVTGGLQVPTDDADLYGGISATREEVGRFPTALEREAPAMPELRGVSEQGAVEAKKGAVYLAGKRAWEENAGFVSGLSQIPGGLKAGTYGLAAGVGSTLEALGGLTETIYGSNDATQWLEGVGAETRQFWGDLIKQEMEKNPYAFEGEFQDNPSWERAMHNIAAAAPSLAAAVVVTTATGNPTAGAGFLGVLEGSGTYAEARAAGKGKEFALVSAGLVSAAITALEVVGLEEVMKGGPNWVSRFLSGGMGESLTEGAQQAVQNAVARIGYDESRQLLQGVMDSMVGSFGAGGAMGAVVGGEGATTPAPGTTTGLKGFTEGVEEAFNQGLIDAETKKVADYLVKRNPGIDESIALEASNILRIATPEILATEGISPDDTNLYAVTGSQEARIEDGIVKAAIGLYQGADATTLVEEWYHNYLDRLQAYNTESYNSLASLYEQAQAEGETRSMQEWFGQQGRDYFMETRPDSPIKALLQKAKESFLKLIGKVRETGAKIDPMLEQHFKGAATQALPTGKAITEVGGESAQTAPLGIADFLSAEYGFDTGKAADAIEAMSDNPSQEFDVFGKMVSADDLRAAHQRHVVQTSYAVQLIETPEFKEKFGNSQVVDDVGAPLVVYHGTQQRFRKFDPKRSAMGGIFWFSSDKKAVMGGEEVGISPPRFVMPVYLKAENLAGWAEYDKYGIGELISLGYDGIKLDDTYVVFDRDQIIKAGPTIAQTSFAVKPIKPMTERMKEGPTLASKIETILSDIDGFTADIKERIDLDSKTFYTMAKEGVLNLQRIEADEDTKALLAGFKEIPGLSELVDEMRRTGVDVLEEAAKPENRLTIEEALDLKPPVTLPAEKMIQLRAMQATAVNWLTEVANRLETATIQDEAAIQDELGKAFFLTAKLYAATAGATAEAGRGLWSFNVMVSPETQILENIMAVYQQRENVAGGVTMNTLAGMIRTAHNKEQFIKSAALPSWLELIHEYWLFSLLSGPKTFAVNIFSNAAFLGLNVVERQVAGLAPAQNIKAGEAAVMMRGMVEGFMDALRLGAQAYISNEPIGKAADVKREPKLTAQTIGAKIGYEDFQNTTIGRGLDFISSWILRGPMRGLAAGDAFFKALAHRMQYRALAYRNAIDVASSPEAEGRTSEEIYRDYIANPNPELMKQAEDFSEMVTFTNEVGKYGKAFQSFANSTPMMRFILPFVRTPSNIARRAIERSPLELAGLLSKNSDLRKALQSKGPERDMAIARLGTGAAIMSTFAYLASTGMVTGSPPENRKLRKSMEREGVQWYSVKVGEKWYSYNRLDPVGVIAGMAADTVYIMSAHDPSVERQWMPGGTIKRGEDQEIYQELPAAILFSLARNLTSKSYLTGLSDFIDATTDASGVEASRYFGRLGTSFVPNVVNQMGMAFDTHRRDAQELIDKWKNRTWIWRDDVPIKRDRWGRKVTDNPIGPIGILFPGYIADSKPDKVEQEIRSIIEGGGTINGLDTGSFDTINGIKLTPELTAEYLTMSGKFAYAILSPLIKGDVEGLTKVMPRSFSLDEMADESLAEQYAAQERKKSLNKKAQQAIDTYASLKVDDAELQTALDMPPINIRGMIVSDVLNQTRTAAMAKMMQIYPELAFENMDFLLDRLEATESSGEVLGIDVLAMRQKLIDAQSRPMDMKRIDKIFKRLGILDENGKVIL